MVKVVKQSIVPYIHYRNNVVYVDHRKFDFSFPPILFSELEIDVGR